MPIVDAEKYKNVPGYQQVCRDEAIRRLSHYGCCLRIKPTADKSLHTFMIKPDGRPFLVYKRSDYLSPILALVFIAFMSMIGLQPKLLYAIPAIAVLLFIVWGIVRLARASDRKNKPIVTINKQGITLDIGTYPWNNITNTFIVERKRPYERRRLEFYLIIALTNQQTAVCRINMSHTINDEASELATTITYFRNNYPSDPS
ncbi:hypothetical protein HHL17_08980 [Chitinophaga sp. G-6-1-13]|uniref:Uncharacterized protein n=2 Tax=Chitinophaga fulva TaxID=2728842 RepID=A0A848GKV3_9BACT|nr:hypothetical protein [Chitinophaga fulva]